MNPFRGTLTALITPFRDGQIDELALQRHVERQLADGANGLVPCGTTGETPALSHDEYKRVLELVVHTAGGRTPVIAGAGSNSTAHTLELIQTAEACGATGLLLVAPYYNKPPQRGLVEHFSAAARATSLPIILYNIPGRCGVEISIQTICRLCELHPNIVAVKHATGSVAGAADLLAVCDVGVLSGDDPLTLPLMSIGAAGVISVLSNLAPAAVKRLTDAALRGDLLKAREAHAALYPVAQALLGLDTNPIPIKTALALRGRCAEEFRLPLCPLPLEKRDELEALLKRYAAELE